MSQSAGKWVMAAGGLIMVAGLSMLPAALGDTHDQNTLMIAACSFSLGMLTMSAGFYFQTRSLQATGKTSESERKSQNSQTKRKGSCDACQSEAPVIQCTVHRVHLCGDCLAQHYDFRACAYTPTTRRAAVRSGKSSAMRAGRS